MCAESWWTPSRKTIACSHPPNLLWAWSIATVCLLWRRICRAVTGEPAYPAPRAVKTSSGRLFRMGRFLQTRRRHCPFQGCRLCSFREKVSPGLPGGSPRPHLQQPSHILINRRSSGFAGNRTIFAFHREILRILFHLSPQSFAKVSSLQASQSDFSLNCSGVSTDCIASLSISIDGTA